VEAEASTPDGRTYPTQAVVPLMKAKLEPTGQKWPDGNPKMREKRDAEGEVIMAPLRGVELANALMRADCVPLESEILTRKGWKTYDAVKIGDEVLAYDCADDTCHWTPLENITVFPEALTMVFGTELHSFRCTPDHSWAIRAEGYKQRGATARGPYTNRQASRRLEKAHAVKAGHRVILSAPAEEGSSTLTPAEAAILGWVMTDGTIQQRKASFRVGICQSKEENFEAIETALTGTGYAVSKVVGKPTTRDFGTYVSECKPQVWWYLSAHDSRALFAKAGIAGPQDLSRVVTQLSRAARQAMFAAMMAADGDARLNFGKIRKPGVMDAWQILATLEGYALGKLATERNVPTQRARKQRYMAGSNVELREAFVEAVWCPTTKYGTWVMRQHGNVTITGNTKASRRATMGLIGLGWMDQEEYGAYKVGFNPQTGDVIEGHAEPVVPKPLETPSPEKAQRNIEEMFGDRQPAYNPPSTATTAQGTVNTETGEVLDGETTADTREPATQQEWLDRCYRLCHERGIPQFDFREDVQRYWTAPLGVLPARQLSEVAEWLLSGELPARLQVVGSEAGETQP
jgi:hypothetical protein